MYVHAISKRRICDNVVPDSNGAEREQGELHTKRLASIGLAAEGDFTLANATSSLVRPTQNICSARIVSSWSHDLQVWTCTSWKSNDHSL